MRRIGLFFGSYNPIHMGHVMIANYMANFTDLDQVWLVVSPQNPLKKKTDLANAYDRLEMVRLAVEPYDNLRVSDIEFNLPMPSYTIDTVTHLKEKYQGYYFALIMGQDNLHTLPKWKNYEKLLQMCRVYMYPRYQIDPEVLTDFSHPSIQITHTPKIEVSASFVRRAIAEGKNISGFLPQPVLEFIESKGLYRKRSS